MDSNDFEKALKDSGMFELTSTSADNKAVAKLEAIKDALAMDEVTITVRLPRAFIWSVDDTVKNHPEAPTMCSLLEEGLLVNLISPHVLGGLVAMYTEHKKKMNIN
jgi:hypothetical protein